MWNLSNKSTHKLQFVLGVGGVHSFSYYQSKYANFHNVLMASCQRISGYHKTCCFVYSTNLTIFMPWVVSSMAVNKYISKALIFFFFFPFLSIYIKIELFSLIVHISKYWHDSEFMMNLYFSKILCIPKSNL